MSRIDTSGWSPDVLARNADLLDRLGRQAPKAPTAASAPGHTLIRGGHQSLGCRVRIALRLGRGGNAREHWSERQRRVREERRAVASELPPFPPALPVDVTIVRVGPKALDTDNLAGACKGVRDAVAAWLGIDDGPEAPATWVYEQRSEGRGVYGVEVVARTVQS